MDNKRILSIYLTKRLNKFKFAMFFLINFAFWRFLLLLVNALQEDIANLKRSPRKNIFDRVRKGKNKINNIPLYTINCIPNFQWFAKCEPNYIPAHTADINNTWHFCHIFKEEKPKDFAYLKLQKYLPPLYAVNISKVMSKK